MAGAAKRTIPTYHLGANTLQIPMTLHKLNRERLVQRLRLNSELKPKSFVLLQAGTTLFRGSSDTEILFRQESYFHWSFGVLEPDFYGAIDVDTGRSILFMPRFSENFAIFMGELSSPKEMKVKYDVEEVRYADEMAHYFKEHSAAQLLTLRGKNTDSDSLTLEAAFPGITEFSVDNTLLFPEITECRVIKTEEELEVLRYCNRISSDAHRHIMSHIRSGMFEYQVESMFHHYCYTHGGMRHTSYTCIGATGCNCSVLHYGHAGAPNERCIQDGDMCLFDMGGEYYCYASDVTCSYPVNGRFTHDQRIIYEAVLNANRWALIGR
jgi:Xaa-Pro dipeptidase